MSTVKYTQKTLGLKKGQQIEFRYCSTNEVKKAKILKIYWQTATEASLKLSNDSEDPNDYDNLDVVLVFGKFYSLNEPSRVIELREYPELAIAIGHEELIVVHRDKGLIKHTYTR